MLACRAVRPTVRRRLLQLLHFWLFASYERALFDLT
jgi:hypothetical protein